MNDNVEPEPSERLPHPSPPGDAHLETGPESLAALGVSIGVGLLVLGLAAAVLAWLDPVSSAPAPRAAAPLSQVLRAGWLVLVFSFAGWGCFALLRLLAGLLRDRLERDSRRLRELETSLDQVVGLLERIAEGMDRGTTSRYEPPEGHERAHAVAEIETALRDAQWALAESLLEAFDTANPSDPKASALRESLGSTRKSALDEQIASLAAAREVNDPARVLDLYQVIAPELEPEHRRTLQSEVARWFLTLLYRRLQTGTIQVDVVELASQFANSFGATNEGASVFAALPTLRRSAGLCPRCAQPYTGVDQACPECQRPNWKAVPPSLPPATDNQPDS